MDMGSLLGTVQSAKCSEHAGGCTKLQDGPLCPLSRVPQISLILTIAHIRDYKTFPYKATPKIWNFTVLGLVKPYIVLTSSLQPEGGGGGTFGGAVHDNSSL